MALEETNNLLKMLEKTLHSFNSNELNDIVLVQFPEISLQQVHKYLKRNFLPVTQKTIIVSILRLIEKKELGQDILREWIYELEMINIVRSKKKTWITYEAFDKNNDVNLNTKVLLTNLNYLTKRNYLNVNINMCVYENKHIFRISKKNIKSVPIYFIIYMPLRYFFCSVQNVDMKLLKSVGQSLGYNKIKESKLSGKNLKHLLYLVANKHISNDPSFLPRKRIMTNGIAYEQNDERSNFVNDIYGENSAALQMITVKKKCTWQLMDNSNENMVLDVEMKLKSSNVLKMIKNLVIDKNIENPMPDYLKNILIHGTNVLNVE